MEIIYDVIYRSAQFTNFEDTMSIDTKMYLVNKVCFNVIIIIFYVLHIKNYWMTRTQAWQLSLNKEDNCHFHIIKEKKCPSLLYVFLTAQLSFVPHFLSSVLSKDKWIRYPTSRKCHENYCRANWYNRKWGVH